EDLRKVAIAVECFHKASLIHDDIEDDDAERYGKQTLDTEHGVAVALNVGDLLLGEGYRLLASLDTNSNIRSEILRAAAEGHRPQAPVPPHGPRRRARRGRLGSHRAKILGPQRSPRRLSRPRPDPGRNQGRGPLPRPARVLQGRSRPLARGRRTGELKRLAAP